LRSGDSRLLDAMVERAKAVTECKTYHRAYDPWRGLLSALSWVERSDAVSAIERLLRGPSPRMRWLAVAASGARRSGQLGLENALDDPHPLVRARAARTLGELGRVDLRSKLIDLLHDHDEDCRFWSAWSAALLGTTEGRRALTAIARAGGRQTDCALHLLLRCLPVEDAHSFLRPLSQDSDNHRRLIQAAGTIGDPRYIPWLVDQVNEPEYARLAADAFVTITGANMDHLSTSPPPDLESIPNDDPDDERVGIDEDDDLPWPDADQLCHWWAKNKGGFVSGTACFMGIPKQSIDWITSLLEAPQRRRWSAACELALRHPGRAMFEVRARGTVQRHLLLRCPALANLCWD
jgi:uncharacterized protein (TIGR02270 family)